MWERKMLNVPRDRGSELVQGFFRMINDYSGAVLRPSEWVSLFKLPSQQRELLSILPPSFHPFQKFDLDDIKPKS